MSPLRPDRVDLMMETRQPRTPGRATIKDKPLFTPGPLTTSDSVKRAMLRDLRSRDHEFRRVIREVRDGFLRVAGLTPLDGFDFAAYYDGVERRGFVIYGGTVLNGKTYRIGTIGRLDRRDVHGLLEAIQGWLTARRIQLRPPHVCASEGGGA